jgi:hypothetical protein
MTQDYVAAQKAIDGLRLNFKSKKAKSANKAASAIIVDNATPCDCCSTITPQDGLTTIESGQQLCHACLKELRGECL